MRSVGRHHVHADLATGGDARRLGNRMSGARRPGCGGAGSEQGHTKCERYAQRKLLCLRWETERIGTLECNMEFVSSPDKCRHICHVVYRMGDNIVMCLHSTPVSYIMHSHPWVEVG